jgi:hypothetical protein
MDQTFRRAWTEGFKSAAAQALLLEISEWSKPIGRATQYGFLGDASIHSPRRRGKRVPRGWLQTGMQIEFFENRLTAFWLELPYDVRWPAKPYLASLNIRIRMALYIGPDQVMPISSVLGTLVGLVLIFWNKLVLLASRITGRPLEKRKTEERASPPRQETTTEGSQQQ